MKGDIKIEIDSFMTDTRVMNCTAFNCINFNMAQIECNLKKIDLGDKGECNQYEKKAE